MRFQEIQEACWTGYQQQGMKKKGNRQVPNCVPVAEVKTGPEITGRDLLFKAAAMAMLAASHEGISLDYEQAIKQASKIYGIPYTPSELPRLLTQRAEIDRQLALLKQGKQVARARRQEKLAPTPVGAEEYWRTHALPTDRIKPATKSLEEAIDPFLDNAARELLGLVIIAGGTFAVGTYYTIVNKLKKYQASQIIDALESKGVTMNRTTYEQVKPLLDQFRQALKDDEGEQAKMLAKRIEQMIVMGKLSAPEPQAQDTTLVAKEKELAEDLKKWFREKWVRFGPDGKIRGDCARGSEKEGKPKCLPQAKAQALGKKGRARAAAKKRREDPNPERRGAAKNVATKVKEADATKGTGQQLSVQQLAQISDAALDSAYGYGRSSPGNTFGWQANLKSAAFAKQMIDRGVTDIEAISDAIHKGWNVTAQAFVKNPQMFDDSKTMAPEKLEAKIAQRQKLMTQQYAQLPEDEKEKDRVVARAMLQAITGQQGIAEDDLDEACWKGYHKEGMKTMFGKRYPNCVKNTKEDIDEAGRIARKPGQPANSRKHSDLYTDENPQGTITGLKFATVEDARASVSKIRSSGRSHAHKVQAAVAMEQRARAAGKASAAAVYRTYINSVKKTDESLETYVDQGVCPVCHGNMVAETQLTEKQDACYHKVKSRYKVWPSAYASGALVQCRKKGAANWGNKKK